MLFTQVWMLAVAGGLAAFTLLGWTTPWVLLAFTCALGVGAALYAPVWQAIQPELVSRSEVPAAVALGGVSINASRAIGPALGGIVVAMAGAGSVFLLNAVSFLAVIVVIYRWRPAPREATLPPERLFGAIRVGVRVSVQLPDGAGS
jgi:MFS family permease